MQTVAQNHRGAKGAGEHDIVAPKEIQNAHNEKTGNTDQGDVPQLTPLLISPILFNSFLRLKQRQNKPLIHMAITSLTKKLESKPFPL